MTKTKWLVLAIFILAAMVGVEHVRHESKMASYMIRNSNLNYENGRLTTEVVMAKRKAEIYEAAFTDAVRWRVVARRYYARHIMKCAGYDEADLTPEIAVISMLTIPVDPMMLPQVIEADCSILLRPGPNDDLIVR